MLKQYMYIAIYGTYIDGVRSFVCWRWKIMAMPWYYSISNFIPLH